MNTFGNMNMAATGQADASDNRRYDSMDDVKRQEFFGEKLLELEDEFNEINKIPGVKIAQNFNFAEQQLPEGYGVAIVPVAQRVEVPGQDEKKSKTAIIGICAIPSVQLLSETETGSEFLVDAVNNALTSRLASLLRQSLNRDHGELVLPLTVEDFAEGGRRSEANKAFNELAPFWVDALKKHGFKPMTVSILRQLLSSAPYASTVFPDIQQETWEGVIHKMIAAAEKKGLPASGLRAWLETRKDVEPKKADDADLAALIESLEI